MHMTQLHDEIARTTRRRVLLALSGLATTAFLACGGANSATAPTPPQPPGPPTKTATINATPAIAFSPAQISLVQGGTVTFAFGAVGHNVYFDNDPAGSPSNIPGVNSNTSVDRTFATAGTYVFNCHIHPDMHGTVTVVPPDTL